VGNPYSFRRRWHRALSETTWFDAHRDLAPVIVVAIAAIVLRVVRSTSRPPNPTADLFEAALILAVSAAVLSLYFIAFTLVPFAHSLLTAGARNARDEQLSAGAAAPVTSGDRAAEATVEATARSDD
jgi:hypothetical protein